MKLTSEQLAEMCHLNDVFIRQLESGIKSPSVDTVITLCNTLKVSPNFLLAGELLENDDLNKIEALCQDLSTLSPKQLDMAISTGKAIIGHIDN